MRRATSDKGALALAVVGRRLQISAMFIDVSSAPSLAPEGRSGNP
jgi:hypothetical protein